MKLKLMQFVMMMAVLALMAAPVWSQDTAQPASPSAESQSEATPAAEDGTTETTEAAGAAETSDTADAADDTAAVQIEDAVVCQDVVDRAPVGSSDMFAKETPKVFCFCRVVGAAAGSQITHNWYYNGSLKASVKLNVGSTNYRTWSSKTLSPQWEGEWMVEILSDGGKPLENIVFMIK